MLSCSSLGMGREEAMCTERFKQAENKYLKMRNFNLEGKAIYLLLPHGKLPRSSFTCLLCAAWIVKF